ncbi:hypothetical protein COC42_03005 [Sphingomonas spermidinifaciens]|uniref:Uncharacterized protein n=1 Tax=Sphingomonas spermidinifaciens TaxID=1141889 RepID=A0A2A4B6G4_9SPHN|nr:hypothetical protein [Sphingomonas spermidinifaciens]PCD03379.1 hypothetical protein COC42_03005 [Sphingomonas spermidinifaciens]
MTLVITACTNRKRKPVSDSLHMAALPEADLPNLADDWARRLARERARFRGDEIYGGRSFREAIAAARLLDARLMVVSAGLGLIDAEASVPPYACTVLIGAPDSISARIIGEFDSAAWWRKLNQASPFAVALHDVASRNDGLICAALSEAYIDMIAADLLSLPRTVLARLRLFTRAPADQIPATLRDFLMPYDDRLDGPDSSNRGTRSDFAGRALRHFAEVIADNVDARDAHAHAEAVSHALEGWRLPTQFARTRHDDAALLDLIRANWDAEGGSSSRLLRRFRDDLGIACEQGRFAQLARIVRRERA